MITTRFLSLVALGFTFTHSSVANTSIASVDLPSLTITIPAVSFNGNVFSGVRLHFDDDGLFGLASGGTTLPEGSAIPSNASFLFSQNLKLIIPKVGVGRDLYSNVVLGLTEGHKLALESADGPASITSISSSVTERRFGNSITVPTDVSAIVYPESYSLASAATIDIWDPYCDLTPSTISFPASYMGSYPLPVPSGAPFPASVRFGVALKDVWQVGNPTFNSGCTGDVRRNFLRTLARLKTLGAKYIQITPWTFVDVSKPTWEIKNPAALNTSTINDADLEWAIATAHAHGFEVHWRNQIQGAVDSSVPSATAENVTKFMLAYETYMLDRAALLQRINADVMMIGCVCWFFPQGETESIYLSKLSELAPKIKAVFSGKLSIWTSTPKIYSDSRLISALDIVELYLLNPNLSSADLKNLTVPTLKSKFADMISGWSSSIDNSKPIIWTIGAPSRNDFFTSGYVEETFCTSGTNTISQTGSDCIQRSMQPDFSFQAMVHEAELEAIREQSYFKTYGVSTDAYWMTEGVIPDSIFPNIAVSIRNKPAEALMRIWFSP